MVKYIDFSKEHLKQIEHNKSTFKLFAKSNLKMVMKSSEEDTVVELGKTGNLDYAMASHYAKIAEDIDMTVKKYLSVKKYFDDLCLPENCFELFEEVLVSFFNSQNMLTIASIGMLAEAYLVHVFELHFENKIGESAKLRKRIEAFEKISQNERINILFSLGIISESTSQMLHQIRENRNKVIHPTSSSLKYNKIAEDMFLLILKVLQKYTSTVRKSDIKKHKC